MGTPAYITVKHVHRLSPKAVRVTLDPGDNLDDWRNIPGGFMTFCLPCGDPVLTRSYSLVQGPESIYPEVIVKETGGTRGSAFVNRKFQAGLNIDGLPSRRDACCQRFGRRPPTILCCLPLVWASPRCTTSCNTCWPGRVDHEITLFYGNSGCHDILLREELDELSRDPRVNVVHILSDGSLDDDLHNGRINASKTMLLMQTVDTALPKKVLLSGPKSMKTEVRRGLDLCRVPEADIRAEDFHHPPHLEASVASTCEVTAEYKGKTVSFTYEPGEETLMDAVLQARLERPAIVSRGRVRQLPRRRAGRRSVRGAQLRPHRRRTGARHGVVLPVTACRKQSLPVLQGRPMNLCVCKDRRQPGACWMR